MLSFSSTVVVAAFVTAALSSTVRAGSDRYCDSTSDKFERLQKRIEHLESQSSNVKHYSWDKLNLETDDGVIKSVKFFKKHIDSSIKLTYSGNLRVTQPPSPGVCARWYFTINNEECHAPHPIDGAIYENIALNLHQHSTIQGICNARLAGDLAIGFHVGKCRNSIALSNAYTCWDSACHIIVEELFNKV